MKTADIVALPLADRLQTMEALWASMDHAAADAAPAWHDTVIEQRLRAISDGRESFSTLDEAFARIAARTPR